jgi:hypothetical protein
MFTERVDMSRSSASPNVSSIEPSKFALRSVNAEWESIERKYLEKTRRASRPSVHWYVSDGALRPSAHWRVSDA